MSKVNKTPEQVETKRNRTKGNQSTSHKNRLRIEDHQERRRLEKELSTIS